MRLGRRTSDGRMMDHHFELSSEDKAASTPRLSVWARELTSVVQAHALTGAKHGVAGFLPVADVRALRPHPDDPVIRSLDVEWERFRLTQAHDSIIEGVEPGCDGHCGITGLDQRTARDAQGRKLDAYRKSLRRELAALANRTAVFEIPVARPQ
jgi:hypothetical protein